MLRKLKIVRKASVAIGGAVDDVVSQFNEDWIEQEPAFTERMVQSTQTAVYDLSNGKLIWRAKTLTDRGAGAQEKIYGADLLGSLHIDIPGFQVRKGFLAQAKLLKPGRAINKVDIKSQCEKMLQYTSAAFVFLYSEDGVRVVPAISVVGAGGAVEDLYSRSAGSFFRAHLECFIGDQAISSPKIGELEKLLEKFAARCAFEISLSKKPD
jgi:hypothetical protein